ncbi:MAG: alpha/beta fold hydrolase [Chitinispirillaceae bacterium]|jgi:alpha/beta superfamily hydrolase
MTEPVFRFIEWNRGGWILRGAALSAQGGGGPTPWCIFSHGFTGHHLGPGYLFARMSRELATAGISSLRFDYGGCGNSDGTFAEMTVATMKADLLSAIDLVRKEHNSSAVVVIGHSLGGMIAALVAEIAQGIVLLSPIAEPLGLMQRRKAMIESGPNLRGFYENGPHELNPQFLDGLRDIDPARSLAGAFRGKLLLIQGDCDKSIAVEESERYVRAARAANIETTMHVLRDADHSYSTVAHFTAVCSTVTSWVKERFV